MMPFSIQLRTVLLDTPKNSAASRSVWYWTPLMIKVGGSERCKEGRYWCDDSNLS